MIMTFIKIKHSKRFERAAFKQVSDELIHENRHLPRLETSNKAFYRNEATQQIVRTKLRNLNLTGVSLYVKGDVRVKQSLMMKIFLNEDQSFLATGTVIWRIFHDDSSYAGVAFEPLEQATQELILEHAL